LVFLSLAPSDTVFCIVTWVFSLVGSKELKKSSLSKFTSNFLAFNVFTSAVYYLPKLIWPNPPKLPEVCYYNTLVPNWTGFGLIYYLLSSSPPSPKSNLNTGPAEPKFN